MVLYLKPPIKFQISRGIYNPWIRCHLDDRRCGRYPTIDKGLPRGISHHAPVRARRIQHEIGDRSPIQPKMMYHPRLKLVICTSPTSCAVHGIPPSSIPKCCNRTTSTMSENHQYSSLQDDINGSRKNSKDSDSTAREYQDLPFQPKKKSAMRRAGSFVFYCILLLIGALAVFKAWDFVVTLEDTLEALEMDGGARQPAKCTTPSIRRSWTTLSDGEKLEYINAVNCLATRPSYINSNSTVYDDFSYMHILHGNMSECFSQSRGAVTRGEG